MPITNSRANISFSYLFSSITGTVTPMPRHLDEKQARLMKEGRCFNCKEKGYTAYNYSKKEKIAAISEGISKDSNNQGKE